MFGGMYIILMIFLNGYIGYKYHALIILLIGNVCLAVFYAYLKTKVEFELIDAVTEAKEKRENLKHG